MQYWLAVFLVVLAFAFNFWLQQRLLKKQNKDKLIDSLLQLLEEQCRFYADYWAKDAEKADDMALSDQIGLQVKFDALMVFVERKYRLENIISIKEKYRNFCKLTTGGDSGESRRKADLARCRRIHAMANELGVKLLENKI